MSVSGGFFRPEQKEIKRNTEARKIHGVKLYLLVFTLYICTPCALSVSKRCEASSFSLFSLGETFAPR